MSHRTASILFERDFHLPGCCFRAGQVECQVVRSRCEVLNFCDDLLTFRVILVLKISVREGGLRCSFEREVVLYDCCWLDRLRVVHCEVVKANCRCRLHHGCLRCAGIVEVRFKVEGGCHWECAVEDEESSRHSDEHHRRESSSSGEEHHRRESSSSGEEHHRRESSSSGEEHHCRKSSSSEKQRRCRKCHRSTSCRHRGCDCDWCRRRRRSCCGE